MLPTVVKTACATSLSPPILYNDCWPAHLMPPGMVQDERAEDEGLDVYRELGPRTARTRGGGGAGEVRLKQPSPAGEAGPPPCIVDSTCTRPPKAWCGVAVVASCCYHGYPYPGHSWEIMCQHLFHLPPSSFFLVGAALQAACSCWVTTIGCLLCFLALKSGVRA